MRNVYVQAINVFKPLLQYQLFYGLC